jgi:hypothetical protein
MVTGGRDKLIHHRRGSGEVGREFLLVDDWAPQLRSEHDANGQVRQGQLLRDGADALQYRGLPIVEHGGADAGCRADFLRFPEQHFSSITLCNTPTIPVALNRKVADLYLASSFPRPAAAPFEKGDRGKLSPKQLSGKDGFFMRLTAGRVRNLQFVRQKSAQ